MFTAPGTPGQLQKSRPGSAQHCPSFPVDLVWRGRPGLPHRLPGLLFWPGSGPDRTLASAVRRVRARAGRPPAGCLCPSVPVRGVSLSLSAREAVSGSVLWSVCLCVSLRVRPAVCLPVCLSPGPSCGRSASCGLSACASVSGSVLWSVCGLSGPPGLSHLAGLEDVKHERQALSHQLFIVLLLLDGAEIPQEALHHRVPRLGEGRPQSLDPDVQLPGDAWTGKGKGSHPPGRAIPKGTTEPTS